jgi:hypothetical protein
MKDLEGIGGGGEGRQILSVQELETFKLKQHPGAQNIL